MVKGDTHYNEEKHFWVLFNVSVIRKYSLQLSLKHMWTHTQALTRTHAHTQALLVIIKIRTAEKQNFLNGCPRGESLMHGPTLVCREDPAPHWGPVWSGQPAEPASDETGKGNSTAVLLFSLHSATRMLGWLRTTVSSLTRDSGPRMEGRAASAWQR